MAIVSRIRAKAAAGPAASASERTLKQGAPVLGRLWGRSKGMACILAERGCYPEKGWKGACTNEAEHSASNDCCCLRQLATQPDFAAERSALQMMIENAGHVCMFIPKVSSPPYMCIEHVLTIADCLYRPRYALHSSTANSTGSSASGQRRKSTRVAIASTRSLVCVRR